jgi:hypothetical protein
MRIIDYAKRGEAGFDEVKISFICALTKVSLKILTTKLTDSQCNV